MGQLVASEARKMGDEIGFVFSTSNASQTIEEFVQHLRGHEAAIDFSVADAVLKNVEACARAAVPLIEGTTGWTEQAQAKQLVDDYDAALVYGANFSVGMNIFYRIVKTASECFAKVDQYAPFIEEAHHSRKRDAPSGTALRLSQLMQERFQSGYSRFINARGPHSWNSSCGIRFRIRSGVVDAHCALSTWLCERRLGRRPLDSWTKRRFHV